MNILNRMASALATGAVTSPAPSTPTLPAYYGAGVRPPWIHAGDPADGLPFAARQRYEALKQQVDDAQAGCDALHAKRETARENAADARRAISPMYGAGRAVTPSAPALWQATQFSSPSNTRPRSALCEVSASLTPYFTTLTTPGGTGSWRNPISPTPSFSQTVRTRATPDPLRAKLTDNCTDPGLRLIHGVRTIV